MEKSKVQQQLVTDTKTLKVSLKVYTWLISQNQGYHDTMDTIISRLINEVEDIDSTNPVKRILLLSSTISVNLVVYFVSGK
ncbi:MAG: hypothetical protein M3P08_15815 [Thermoproteota archaeon]|nr:hypothetical protein [Thermoproteota archaeon]